MSLEKLLEKAKQASKNAYAKYSGYPLGAALLGKSQKVYTGVNVENASYGLTNCAERSAVFTAITQGEREFTALAVYVQSSQLFPPCGACRQVLSEFCPASLPIVYGNDHESVVTTLGELLPQSFSLEKRKKY